MLKWQPRTKDCEKGRALHRVGMGVLVVAMVMVTVLQGLTDSENALVSAEAEAGRHGRLVMYVYDDAGFTPSESQAALVDQVNYAFALIKDGEATAGHWYGIRQMSAWLKRHPEVDGVLSVGGWGADGFSQACMTVEGRTRLANSILKLMDDHGFVGVDIDWEYPGSSAAGIASDPQDEENWYALLSLLRQGLDERAAERGRPYLLSVAVGAGKAQLEHIDAKRLNELVDQVVLMAYDLRGFDRMTGHHAGLYPDGKTELSGAWAAQKLLREGLSPSRLLLGVPAYGRMWRQVSGSDGMGQRAGTSGNKTLTFSEVCQLEAEGYTSYWDEDAQAAWYYNGSNFVSAENETSLKAKMQYVLEQNLLGTAVWSWNSDADGAMLEIMNDALTP